ncbi:hypothetical protein FW764_02260 [Pseudomonas sp. 1152_12]
MHGRSCRKALELQPGASQRCSL